MTAARLLGNAAEENNFRSISCPRDAPEPLQRHQQPQIAAVFCVSVRIAPGGNKYLCFFLFHLLVCDPFTFIESLADVFMSNQFSVYANKTNKLNVNVLLSYPFVPYFTALPSVSAYCCQNHSAPEVCFCNSVITVYLFDMEPLQHFMFLTSLQTVG